MKAYKAIFFDWDGTAVYSRTAPTQEVMEAMKPLLRQGTKLAIISGTTLENISQGRLHEAFSVTERQNLFYGLARGAANFRFNTGGELCEFASGIPDKSTLLRLHEACFRMHQWLLEQHDLPTDVVFSRPNYAKIDLTAASTRGSRLFMQEGELDRLEALLTAHGMSGGSRALIQKGEAIGKELGIKLCATTDGKYLELGFTLKSDNVDAIFSYLQANFAIKAEDCSFWGDEYVKVGEGIYGSDSYMMTDQTRKGDFFDVSELAGERPEGVQWIGGGVERFLTAMREAGEGGFHA